MTRRKRYSAEFKREALRRANEPGVTDVLVAEELGINARSLNDLRVPPANRLEALRGKRVGQHSIRINDQWRICFFWNEGDALNVEIVDYH